MGNSVAAGNADTVYLETAGDGRATYSMKRETLAKFDFFRELMSGSTSNMFSVDANQEVFHHIVTYLRRGTYPLVIDAEGRHDIPTYLTILEEANHFWLWRLAKWIEEGRYGEVARVECTTRIRGETDLDEVGHTEISRATVTLKGVVSSVLSKECFPHWGQRQFYCCPRGLHDGNQDGCGKKCMSMLGDSTSKYYEIKTICLLEVEKKLVIDTRLCRDEDW